MGEADAGRIEGDEDDWVRASEGWATIEGSGSGAAQPTTSNMAASATPGRRASRRIAAPLVVA
jgi:hypothetical protein